MTFNRPAMEHPQPTSNASDSATGPGGDASRGGRFEIKRFDQHIDGLDFILFLAMNGAEIVGSVEAKHGHRRMMFRNLYVAPDYRRQGVAFLLLQRLLDAAKETERYLSCVVMSDNKEAMALYRKPVDGWRLMEQDCNLELVTLEWWPTR